MVWEGVGWVKGQSEGANRKKSCFEATKRSAGNRIGYQVIDRQVETRPMSAGTQVDRAVS